MLFLKDHPHCLPQHENDRVFLAGSVRNSRSLFLWRLSSYDLA